MDELIQLLEQIRDLASAGIDALSAATEGEGQPPAEGGGEGPPPEQPPAAA